MPTPIIDPNFTPIQKLAIEALDFRCKSIYNNSSSMDFGFYNVEDGVFFKDEILSQGYSLLWEGQQAGLYWIQVRK